MARASKKDAEKHRQEIVAAAARLFRERGIDGVSVPELMAAAGLTHGGFYGHFASKSALAAEAIGVAADELGETLADIRAGHEDDPEATLASLVDVYLSPRHRDQAGAGCPTAALIDVGRSQSDPALKDAYLESVERMIAHIETSLPPDATREQALATLATLVGGLLLSRATAGTPLSDEILVAARGELIERCEALAEKSR